MARVERLGDVIAKKRVRGPARKKARLDIIRSSWPSLVGERMSEHTRPARLSRGTLVVSADGGPWAAEFSLQSKGAMDRIERMLGGGAVTGIKVQSRAWKKRAQGAKGEVPREEVTHEKRELELEGTVAESLERVEDEDVRKALEKLAKASRTSRQSKHVEE